MFPLISKSDLLHFVGASKSNSNVLWQAVIRWFSITREESGKVLLDVMKSINLPEFPFLFLLETVLNEPMLKKNNPCNQLVIDSLFQDVEKMKSNLSTETFFGVKKLAKSHKVTNHEKVNTVVVNYLAENFEELVDKEGFRSLEKDEIVSLYQATKITCSSEKAKWNAALKWIKHDQRRRKKVFEKLFKAINLELLPPDFFHQTVRNETLVKESRECMEILLDFAFASGGRGCKVEGQTLIPHIACLDWNGNIKALNLTTNQWKDLPSVKDITTGHWHQKQIINVDDEIYCLDDETILMLDQNELKWIRKQSRVKRLSGSHRAVAFNKRIHDVDCDVTVYYDVIKDVWTENLPGCRLGDYFCAAASDKFIYAIGGYENGKFMDEAKRFDPETQTWSPIARLNTGRNGASAAVLNNSVYVVGGENEEEINLNSVEVFHENYGKWTTISNMFAGRAFPCSCAADNKLYVVGGDKHSIECFDENEWKIVKEYDWGRIFSCCVVNLRCEKN